MYIDTADIHHDERSIIQQVWKKNPTITVRFERKEEQSVDIKLNGFRVNYYPPAIVRLFSLIHNFNAHPSNEFVEKDVFLRPS